jgi:hypothetical protein
MADNNQPIEWYLARDGQQHGPVTDAELKKIIELGYLRPTDLVWRQGMAEWAVAETVLDLKPAAPPAPVSRPAPGGAMPQADGPTVDPNRRYVQPAANPHQGAGQPTAGRAGGGPSGPERGHARPEQAQAGPSGPSADAAGMAAARAAHAEAQRTQASGAAAQPSREPQPAGANRPGEGAAPRQFPWRMGAALVLVGVTAAGALALYRSGALSELPFLAAPMTSGEVPVVARPSEAAREATGAVADGSGLPQGLEQRLQRSPLWAVLRAKFPDWYAGRVAEIAKLSADSKSEREIDAAMTRAVVDLRRRHQAEALAASPERVKAMAASFVESLERLAKISTSACYGYISQGESSPAIADLTSPDQRAAIDVQLATVFDAIVDGRQSPAQRQSPKREDYDVLSKELAQRGWSAADLQLFTDARALSRAAPEKVCQMVQDWFSAQLAVPDEEVKLRLLSEALKPVVAG